MRCQLLPLFLTYRSSGRHHDLLHATRVRLDELGDVIHLAVVGHPDARGSVPVLGDLLRKGMSV